MDTCCKYIPKEETFAPEEFLEVLLAGQHPYMLSINAQSVYVNLTFRSLIRRPKVPGLSYMLAHTDGHLLALVSGEANVPTRGAFGHQI